MRVYTIEIYDLIILDCCQVLAKKEEPDQYYWYKDKESPPPFYLYLANLTQSEFTECLPTEYKVYQTLWPIYVITVPSDRAFPYNLKANNDFSPDDLNIQTLTIYASTCTDTPIQTLTLTTVECSKQIVQTDKVWSY